MVEDTAISTFNEASFKMKRLHELQELCNKLRQCPYKVYTKTNKLCFVTHFDALLSLYQEVSSKLTTKERDGEEGEDKPDGILKGIKALKVKVRNLRNAFSMDNCGSPKLETTEDNKKLKDEVEDGIFDCEEVIRKLLDEHGFSTMNTENSEGDVYN